MTRDEVLLAVNRVFGAEAWAVAGFWDIKIETTPKRTLMLSTEWVERHINSGTMTVEELEDRLRSISDDQWLRDNSDNLVCLFR